MKVLIAGAAGRVGKVLTRELQDDHELMLGDVVPIDDPRFVPFDVRDGDQVREVVPECDAVIYLSMAQGTHEGGWDGLRYADEAFGVHVIGLHNVLQAALDFGKKRVLYTSTVSAVDAYPKHIMIGPEDRHRGGRMYGLTKGFGEELCYMFHQHHHLPVVVLRLGSFYTREMEAEGGTMAHPSVVHESDVARAFACVLAASRPHYALIHVVGDNLGRQWEIETARCLFHWEPEYTFNPDWKPRKLRSAATEE